MSPAKYPALPTTLMTLLGPVAVELKDKWDDADAWGLWQRERRTIEIDKRLARNHQWSTLFHELMHATLDDSGLSNLLTEPQQEALCDASATARMRERFG